ncbi:MAG: LapA family protein [Nitrospirae bacterium]|nr:LapA family protein [Nitrospirota bacterium]
MNTRLITAAPSNVLLPDHARFILLAQAYDSWTFLDHGPHEKEEKGECMITLVFVIAVAAVMVLFSVQNAAPVVVSFLSWKFEASLAVIILLCVLIGMLIGGATVSFWRFRRSIKKRRSIEQGPSDGRQRP